MEKMIKEFIEELHDNNLTLADIYSVNEDDYYTNSIYVDSDYTREYLGKNIYENPDFDEFYYDELHDGGTLVDVKGCQQYGYTAYFKYRFDDDSEKVFEFNIDLQHNENIEEEVADLIKTLSKKFITEIIGETLTIYELLKKYYNICLQDEDDYEYVTTEIEENIDYCKDYHNYNKTKEFFIDCFIFGKMDCRRCIEVKVKMLKHDEKDLLDSEILVITAY